MRPPSSTGSDQLVHPPGVPRRRVGRQLGLAEPHPVAVGDAPVHRDRRKRQAVAEEEVSMAARREQRRVRPSRHHPGTGRPLQPAQASGVIVVGVAVEEQLHVTGPVSQGGEIPEDLRGGLGEPAVDEDEPPGR